MFVGLPFDRLRERSGAQGSKWGSGIEVELRERSGRLRERESGPRSHVQFVNCAERMPVFGSVVTIEHRPRGKINT